MLNGTLTTCDAGNPIQLPSVRLTANAGERMRGLLGSSPLGHGDALWIRPCNSVHSLFMRYAIDIVYLDRQQQVCKCVEAMKPWRISFCWQAQSVLELAAGQIHTLGIDIGRRFQWQKV